MILTSEAIRTRGIRTGESTLVVLVSTTRVCSKCWGAGGGGDARPCVLRPCGDLKYD